MKREEVYQLFKQGLTELSERELHNLAKIYCEDVDELSKTKIKEDIVKINANVPIQYVTGKEFFLDYSFKVSPAVLIPRPETEELVAWVYEDFKGNDKALYCLDVGTGSGIIPISLKLKFPAWNVQGIDVSAEALAVAKENAFNLEAEINLTKADFLKKEEWSFAKVDILISNPPYIPFAEAEKMGASVLKHEPHVALFVDDPLIFYKTLCVFSKEYLNKNGVVYAELNEYQAEETESVFLQYFDRVEIKKDLQGKNRMLKASLLLS